MKVYLPVLLLALLAAPAAAQGEARAKATAQEAISQLRSPYCPGLMLEVCPSAQAELLRDSIRAMAAAGVGTKEIVEDVLARHGEEWRAVPKKSGVGLWAWIATPAVLLLGVLLVAVRLRTMRGGAALAPEPAADALSGDDRARLAAAMAEYEGGEE
jgi:cytochrome c-type biogenesis protein CcmH/NrfF